MVGFLPYCISETQITAHGLDDLVESFKPFFTKTDREIDNSLRDSLKALQKGRYDADAVDFIFQRLSNDDTTVLSQDFLCKLRHVDFSDPTSYEGISVDSVKFKLKKKIIVPFYDSKYLKGS